MRADTHPSDPARAAEAWKPTRRRLLAAGTGAAAFLAGGGPLGAAPFRLMPRRKDTAPVPWHEPPAVHSAGGVLTYTLGVGGTKKQVPTCSGVTIQDVIRRYNGLPVGATLRIRRGDLLDLVIKNDLPANACNPANFDSCCPPSSPSEPVCCPADVNVPHCFNTTNLHTHGLHVSPASFLTDDGELVASDEVLLHVDPGHVQRYCIQLPDFHAPGTYWYHAHKHGATAVQLTHPNALCGALIVEEDDDETFLPPGTPDRVWLIQESVGVHPARVYSCVMPGPLPSSQFLVNGKLKPTLTIHAGQVERWRFVNATSTPRGFGRIQLLDPSGAPQPMYLIAVDGILFYGKAPQQKLEWQLAPGGRADFLVRLPATGTAGSYRVRKAAEPDVPVTTDQDLAVVKLSADVVPGVIPPVLPPLPQRTCYLRPIHSAEPKDAPVVFGVGGPSCAGQDCVLVPRDFTIDGLKFDPGRVDHHVPLGSVQEWELVNTFNSLHPFHIHVNPFQVVGEPIDPAGPDAPGNWMWRDTVALSAAAPTRIRHRFLTYDGKYVLHCHILNHEDLGMMQIVQAGDTVYDPATGARISGNGVGPCETAGTCSF